MLEYNQLPLIALRGLTLVPNTVQRIEIIREASIKALEYSKKNKTPVFFVTQINKTDEIITSEEQLFDTGVVCFVKEILARNNGITALTLDCAFSAKLIDFVSVQPVIISTFKEIEYYNDLGAEFEAHKNTLKDELKKLNSHVDGLSDCMNRLSNENDDINSTLNILSYVLEHKNKQDFISECDTISRIKKLLITIRECRIKAKILQDLDKLVNEKVKNSQKEYVLREQLKVIKSELGDDDRDYEELKQKIEKLVCNDDVRAKLNKELERLNRMSPMSPEYSMLRNYLDWVLTLPWGVYTQDNYDISNIMTVLDSDHYGLEKVKERIVEYMAVKKLTGGTNKAPILCFVGAPGVGKTSIAQSIAKAVGKEYLHMSLGGISDESEIRGHRKTYIGSMPGRIMTSMSKGKTSNPLFLLDEIDKMKSDMRGDPSSALLEVLDPNQNNNFRDNYLEIPYDLSQVMFIMTANSLSTIQKPLLDRMEIIEMSGYTVEEKLNIATKYLIPKQIIQNGLENCEVTFEESAVISIIDSFTKESGVRELERKIGAVCRKIASRIVNGENFEYIINSKNIEEFLGVSKFIVGEDVVNGEIGTVNGLAWTSLGGTVMPLEVSILPNGKGEVVLTGSLGDVMKESAKIAISLLKSKSEELGIEKDFFTTNDIHIHVPEGATPKDGPSAGIALSTALASAVLKKPTMNDLAMTGEITLRGKVLAIGGLKEKTLAAQRNGIKKVIIPKQNQKDLQQLPQCVLDGVQFVLADNINDVFSTAFGG